MMITYKEKASELIEKFKNHSYKGTCEEDDELMCKYHATKSAIISTDEVITLLSNDFDPLVNYWFDVKRELEKHLQ